MGQQRYQVGELIQETIRGVRVWGRGGGVEDGKNKAEEGVRELRRRASLWSIKNHLEKKEGDCRPVGITNERKTREKE